MNKMETLITLEDLFSSNAIDSYMFRKVFTRSYLIPCILFYLSPFVTIINFIAICAKSYGPKADFRKVITFISFGITFLSFDLLWFLILTGIEIIHWNLTDNLFPFVHWISETRPSPLIETLIKKIYHFVRIVLQTDLVTTNQLHEKIMRLFMMLCSNISTMTPFEDHEWNRIKKCLSKLEHSKVYCINNKRIIINFSDEMYIRVNWWCSIQAVVDSNFKLIDKENLESSDWECSVCSTDHRFFALLNCKGKAKHELCLSCCFKWFEQNYNCPFCRTEFS